MADAALVSASQKNDHLTDITQNIPYIIATVTLENINASDDVRVFLRSVDETREIEYEAGVTADSFQADGDNLQMTLPIGTNMALYSDTVGAHSSYGSTDEGSHSVFLAFEEADAYNRGFYRIESVDAGNRNVTVTLDVSGVDGVPTVRPCHLPLAGDVGSYQGSATGHLRGNLYVDELDEEATGDKVYQVYVYLESGSLNDEYSLNIAVRDENGVSRHVENEVFTMTETFSARSSISCTILDFNGNATVSPFYVYPGHMSARGDSGGWEDSDESNDHITVLEGVISGGVAPYQAFITQLTDGVADDLTIDVPYVGDGAAADTFQVCFKSTAGTPTARNGQESLIRIVLTDAEGRYFQFTQIIALLARPTFTITENPSTARVGVYDDGTGYGDAAVFDEVDNSTIAVLKAEVDEIADGGVGFFSMHESVTALAVNPTWDVNVRDSAATGGKVAVTFTDTAGTSGVADYFSVGDHMHLGGAYDEQGTVASIDGVSLMTLTIDYVADADGVTVTAQDSVNGYTHLGLLNAVSMGSGAVKTTLAASGELIFTENGIDFDVMLLADGGAQPAIELWKFDALVVADFTFVLDTLTAGSFTAENDILKVDSTTAPNLSYTVSWPQSKGLGEINKTSIAFAVDAALTMPGSDARTNSGAIVTDDATTAVDANDGDNLSITLPLSTAFGTFFDGLADGKTAYMDISATLTMANTLSEAVSAPGDLSTIVVDDGSDTSIIRIFDDLANADIQTRFHIDYADTGDVFQDGTVLLPALSVGGGYTAYDGGTTLTFTDTNDIVGVDAADEIRLTAAALTAPKETTGQSFGLDDSLGGTVDNSVTSSDFNVYFWRQPLVTITDASPITCVPVTDAAGDTVETATWIEYPFTISHGHTLVNSGYSAMAKTFDLSFSDARTLTCSLDEGVVSGASASDFDGATVCVKRAHTNYNELLFTATVVDGAVTLVLDDGQDDFSTHGASAISAYLEKRDATVDTMPLSVAFDETAGNDTMQANYDVRVVINGASSKLFLRLVSTSPSDYATTNPIVARLSSDAFTLETADNSDGAVGSSGTLWAAQTTDLSISFTAITWDLVTTTDLSDTILANFGAGTGALAAEGDDDYDFADMNDAQTLLLSREVTVDQVDVSEDKFMISVKYLGDKDDAWDSTAVDDAIETARATTYADEAKLQESPTASTAIAATAFGSNGAADQLRLTLGAGSSLANYIMGMPVFVSLDGADAAWYILVAVSGADDAVVLDLPITYTGVGDAYTAATVAYNEADEDGVFFRVGGAGYYGNHVKSTDFTSGQSLSLNLLPRGANSVQAGHKYLILLTTEAGCTHGSEDTPLIKNRFLRRVEVRFSGGLSAFELSKDNEFSWPGATSFVIPSVTVYNTGGTQLSTDPADHTWDVMIEAAVTAKNNTTPPDADDATQNAWRFEVLALQTNMEYSDIDSSDLKDALTKLPDIVVVTDDDDIESAVQMDKYNGLGLLYNNSNAKIMRMCYRVSMRVYNETADTMHVGDEGVVSRTICAATSVADQDTSVVTFGSTSMRQAMVADAENLVIVGQETVGPWADSGTNSIPGGLTLFAFSREVQRWNVVTDATVLAGP